jgi:hypothetical protein
MFQKEHVRAGSGLSSEDVVRRFHAYTENGITGAAPTLPRDWNAQVRLCLRLPSLFL